MLKQLKGWIVEDGKLVKLYPFKNYYETMAFVNALAWISHREDHHPDLQVGYNKCRVEYSTHAIGGQVGERFHLRQAKSGRAVQLFDETGFQLLQPRPRPPLPQPPRG